MSKNKSILEVKNLEVLFEVPTRGFFSKDKLLYAVNNVNFNLLEGETLGIVGESGCGKSTLARAILKLLHSNSIIKGDIHFLNENIVKLNVNKMKILRKDMQVVFQDPLASLDPRMTISEIISEPLTVYYPKLSKEQILEKVVSTMKLVGLDPKMMYRYPHEFSGGMNQRVGIARAVILKPKLLICDEAVSALDVSIKSQIINLLKDLKKRFNMSLLFISHDLSIVKYISDKVMVLYLGEIMELSDADNLYINPQHPYTKALIEAVPMPDPDIEKSKVRSQITGELPSPFELHKGCPFSSRCPLYFDKCSKVKPKLKFVNNSMVACHRVS